MFQLEEGYRLNTDEIIFDDTYLYITAYKNEQISLKDKTEMEIALKTKLYRIHLSSGKYDTIKNTDDETILGVEGRNIIFEGNIYKEDPQKYLNNKDYDKYYSALLNSKKKFEIYNIDTKKSKVIETDEDTIETYYQGSVYWIDHNHVMKLNLKTVRKKYCFLCLKATWITRFMVLFQIILLFKLSMILTIPLIKCITFLPKPLLCMNCIILQVTCMTLYEL